MGNRILIVDDSKTTLQVVQVHLMGRDFEFSTAANGKEAAALIERSRPDLVISDLDMPGVTGIELCVKLRAHRELRSLPFVIVTSHKDTSTRRKVFAAGADGFLTKPLQPDQLNNVISRLLNPSQISSARPSRVSRW